MSLFFEKTLLEASVIEYSSQFFQLQKDCVVTYTKKVIKNKSKVNLRYSLWNYKTSRFKNIFTTVNINKVDEEILPRSLKIKVKSAIRYMELELAQWLCKNVREIEPIALQFIESLQWTSTAKVDVQKTLSTIFENPQFDIYHRFLLSCTYFCEDSVNCLWDQLSNENKINFASDDRPVAKYWTYVLRDKLWPPITLPEELEEDACLILAKDAVTMKNISAAMYLWPKLSQDDKFALINTKGVPDDLVDFILIDTVVQQHERLAYHILKASIDNVFWHEAFISHLNTYKEFILTEDVYVLFKNFITMIKNYPNHKRDLKFLLRKFLTEFESKIEIDRRDVFLKHLVDDKESSHILLNDLTYFDKEISFLEMIDTFIAQIEKDKYEWIDFLVKHFENEEEIVRFKTRFATRSQSVLSLLKYGRVKTFIKVIKWASLTEEIWDQYKRDILLYKNRYALFRTLICTSVPLFRQFIEVLFLSLERIKHTEIPLPLQPLELDALATYMKEDFVPNYAERIFHSFLISEEYDWDFITNLNMTKQFFDFCFQDKEEKEVAMKKFLQNVSPDFGLNLLEYREYKDLERILVLCHFTDDEKVALKIKIFLDTDNLSAIQNAIFNNPKLVDRILKDCNLTKDEIVDLKNKYFSSPTCLEDFERCLIEPEILHLKFPIQWKTIEKAIAFLQPSDEEVLLFKAKFLEKFPNEREEYNHLFKLMDERKK